MQTSMKRILMSLPAILALLVLAVPEVMAGTGGTEFQTLWDTLVGWTEGLLGRTIALVFVMVGLAAGVLRGSIFGFVSGIAAGIGLHLTPTILANIVTATLP